MWYRRDKKTGKIISEKKETREVSREQLLVRRSELLQLLTPTNAEKRSSFTAQEYDIMANTARSMDVLGVETRFTLEQVWAAIVSKNKTQTTVLAAELKYIEKILGGK